MSIVRVEKHNSHWMESYIGNALISSDKYLQTTAIHNLIQLNLSPMNTLPFMHKLFLKLYENTKVGKIRILVEVGKAHPTKIKHILSLASQQSNEELHWCLSQEILELIPFHPVIFILELKKILYTYNVQNAWSVLTSLVAMKQKYPELVEAVLAGFFYKKICRGSCCTTEPLNLPVREYIARFEMALIQNCKCLQWKILFELGDYVPWYPNLIIPLFEKATSSQFLEIRWFALLQLMQAIKSFPQYTLPLIKKLFHGQDENTNLEIKTRALVLLGKEYLLKSMEIISDALLAKDPQVNFIAMYELAEICGDDIELRSEILQKITTSKNCFSKIDKNSIHEISV